jgi:hypothetical protein
MNNGIITDESFADAWRMEGVRKRLAINFAYSNLG